MTRTRVVRTSARMLFGIGLLLRGGWAGEGETVLAKAENGAITAAAVDGAGDIYIAGHEGAYPHDAFAARLKPDGTQVYRVTFAGSKDDFAAALALDAAGALYVGGSTQSNDFPTTPGAMRGTFVNESYQGFVVKLDAHGAVVYSTVLDEASFSGVGTGGLLVNSAGEAAVSGGYTSAVLRLDATGTRIAGALRGAGGLLAADAEGNFYVAGVTQGSPTPAPITPGAFQSTYELHPCGGSAQLAFGCPYQYVAKLDAGLTKIEYATYLAGSYGATPAAIVADADGSVTVAGTTNSPDYPTTAGAAMPNYTANAPEPPQVCLWYCVHPPPASGYVTKLNATGTGLLYSTYVSGTQKDSIGFAARTETGLLLGVGANSADLPGLSGMPARCLPQTVAATLSADGSALAAVRAAPGRILAREPATGALLVWTEKELVRFDATAKPDAIACVLDGSNYQKVRSVAPGQLVTIFGNELAAEAVIPPAGTYPTALGGVTAEFSGQAAPLLYVSPNQVNVQVPFEIAGETEVTLRLADASRTLAVVPRMPAAQLDVVTDKVSVDPQHCRLDGLQYGGGPLPLAFNEDGSRNTCQNPARQGSIVTLIFTGLGLTSPAQTSGAVNAGPGVALNLPVTITQGAQSPITATALAGSIAGVWRVEFYTPAGLGQGGALRYSFAVDGTPLSDAGLTVWVR